MERLEEWVAHENIAKLERQLADPAFAGRRLELQRQIAEQRRKVGAADGPVRDAGRPRLLD
ncbi:MAG: hypothetical protein P4L73_06645 [Caulobacteraceae bacterium]|nr:hypothetical protein [Caulobacteraceae bacterium]